MLPFMAAVMAAIMALLCVCVEWRWLHRVGVCAAVHGGRDGGEYGAAVAMAARRAARVCPEAVIALSWTTHVQCMARRWLRAREVRPRPPTHDSRGPDCTECPLTNHGFASTQMKRIEIDIDVDLTNCRCIRTGSPSPSAGRWAGAYGLVRFRSIFVVQIYVYVSLSLFFQQRSGIENFILLKTVENIDIQRGYKEVP